MPASTGWELYDATERRTVAVGYLSDVMLAHYELVEALRAAEMALPALSVRPYRSLEGRATRQHVSDRQ